jgi:hypothetical protein
MINRVVITDGAKKDIRRVPAAVADVSVDEVTPHKY